MSSDPNTPVPSTVHTVSWRGSGTTPWSNPCLCGRVTGGGPWSPETLGEDRSPGKPLKMPSLDLRDKDLPEGNCAVGTSPEHTVPMSHVRSLDTRH